MLTEAYSFTHCSCSQMQRHAILKRNFYPNNTDRDAHSLSEAVLRIINVCAYIVYIHCCP